MSLKKRVRPEDANPEALTEKPPFVAVESRSRPEAGSDVGTPFPAGGRSDVDARTPLPVVLSAAKGLGFRRAKDSGCVGERAAGGVEPVAVCRR